MGDSRQLEVITTPENAEVSWNTLNGDIAAVDESGIVTAIAAGTTSITATITIDGESYIDACVLTVS